MSVDAFFEAVRQNDVYRIDAELSKGLDIDCREPDGSTCLIVAAHNNNRDLAEELLIQGANVNARDNEGKTALMVAAKEDNERMALLLLTHGANVHFQTLVDGGTALHYCVFGDGKVAQHIINYGVNVNIRNGKTGETPLMTFASLDDKENLDFILDHGADMDLRDQWGRTALMEAADMDNLDILKKLLKRGANTWIIDMLGETAFSLAKNAGYSTAKDMIKEAGKVRSLKDLARFSYNKHLKRPLPTTHWRDVNAPQKVVKYLRYEDQTDE